MLMTVIGLLLLIAPFLLLGKFQDKKIGFAYILSFAITFQLSLAIITQGLHIFTYPVVLGANIAAVSALMTLFRADLKSLFRGLRLDWALIFVIVIAFISLYAVHYDYSGKYTTLSAPYEDAKNLKYPYPYYSDEWYAVAFIQDSIESQSLPTKNPLAEHRPAFINLELAFHSFLSALVLILGLNPLTQYTVLTIFAGLLIVVLIYLLLRTNGIAQLPGAIAALAALYITNGSNLPGLWNLLPLTVGIIATLLSMIFATIHDKKMLLAMAFITLLFYPPLFVFSCPFVLVHLFAAKTIPLKEKVRTSVYYLGTVIVAASVVSFFYFLSKTAASSYFDYVLFSKILYPTFIPEGFPAYTLYNVLPVPVLIAALFGIPSLLKKQIWLLAMVAIGLAYWLLYSFSMFRIIIEYERAVVSTSILIVIMAGFGLHYLVQLLKQTNLFKHNAYLNYTLVGVLMLFLAFSFNYTERGNWQNLVLRSKENDRTFSPAAPANTHLHPDDLRLFSNIHNQLFLSFPWKGTVIGTATNNNPAATKPGTITIDRGLSTKFLREDCISKNESVITRSIKYVYFPKFDCPNFHALGTSAEGLTLYEFRE